MSHRTLFPSKRPRKRHTSWSFICIDRNVNYSLSLRGHYPEAQLSANGLGSSFIPWAGSSQLFGTHVFVKTLTSTTDPAVRAIVHMQLQVPKATVHCYSFEVFLHFSTRDFYLFCIQLSLKYFLCYIWASISMYFQWKGTVAELVLSHYSLCTCLSPSTRL